MPPLTKLAQLKARYTAGDQIGALRIAAHFPALGDERLAITRGWAAASNPAFYRQIGHDPERLLAAGLAALRAKYRLD